MALKMKDYELKNEERLKFSSQGKASAEKEQVALRELEN